MTHSPGNFHRQLLADRYLEATLADMKRTGAFVLLAPAVGLIFAAIWHGAHTVDPALFLAMALAAMGCSALVASQEILRERALFLRERSLGISVGAYLYSKIRVLSLIAVVQSAALALVVNFAVTLSIPVGWTIITLWFAALCGVCLGLLISACARRGRVAAGLVFAALGMQVVVSAAVLPVKAMGTARYLLFAMPAHWSVVSLHQFSLDMQHQVHAAMFLPGILVFSAIFVAATHVVLRRQAFD